MPFTPSPRLRGDRVQNAGPGEPVELWIYSAFPKDNWLARKPGDWTHAEHPGTAIRMGEELFEILTVQETSEPGYVVRYGLKRWDPKHAIRMMIPYTPQTQAQSAADYLDERHKQDLRARILWLIPLAGLAPDPVQREWERKTALNMAVISAVSAITVILLFMTLVQAVGPQPKKVALIYVIYYLGFESFARLLWIVFTGKPHGTLLLTLPYILWEGVARPEKGRREKEEWVKFSYGGDEVIRRPGAAGLQIRSMLFDDMLIGPNPIRFEGALYKPVSWHQEGAGLSRRLVYDLEKTDAPPTANYREYTQPRSPQRQAVVEELTRNRDRTQILTFLWGTYPRHEQLRLEAKYQFPAVRWTTITAGLLLACAALQFWATALFHAPNYSYASPVYFLFESLYRLHRSKVRLEPAGSLVGYVLGVFLRPPE